jgi:hypothetical protein
MKHPRTLKRACVSGADGIVDSTRAPKSAASTAPRAASQARWREGVTTRQCGAADYPPLTVRAETDGWSWRSWLENDIHREHRDYLAPHGGQRAETLDSDHHRIQPDASRASRGASTCSRSSAVPAVRSDALAATHPATPFAQHEHLARLTRISPPAPLARTSPYAGPKMGPRHRPLERLSSRVDSHTVALVVRAG